MLAKTPGIETLLCEAIEIASDDERRAYLDRACEGDPEARRELDCLLDAHARAGRFLESPPLPPTLAFESREVDVRVEAVIGPYTLIEPIGEGGMGTVYLAEQTSPVRRQVALKVIKPGMDTRQVVARFEVERQALGMMHHPNIARVLDGGATEYGRPYFVMELVRGTPITDYCDEERLTIRERLELFVEVCRAVQHAHQKGIIHRDLKPSNVLVTVIDGVAVPKVIDFGVAKATGGALVEFTLHTSTQQLVGTPMYMSPEQADPSCVDVDTRADIYALGVLLYELLTGTTPFDAESLRSAGIDGLRQILREHEPPTPSRRLASLAATHPGGTSDRKPRPRHLGRSLRGDLDWIVMKALEKDRGRRYGTANGFAADVERYLCDQPVEARPPSASYRFAKFARRNRATLSTACLVAIALVAGTAVSIWQASRATWASAEAARREVEAQQVVQYLIDDVFGAATLEKAPGHSISLFEVLNTSDHTIGERFRDQPLVEAGLRMMMGKLFGEFGKHDEAFRQYERAFALRRGVLGLRHPETLAAGHELVYWLAHRGRGDESIAMGRSVLAARRRVLGPTHPDTLFTAARLALVMGKSPPHRDEALLMGRRAAATAARVLGPDHEVTYLAIGALAKVYLHRGELAPALALTRQEVDGFERVLGPMHPETLWGRAHLMFALRAAGRYAEARIVSSETLERFGRVNGVAHHDTIGQLKTTIGLLQAEGNHAGARDLAQDWIRRILNVPVDDDSWSRYRRSVNLASLVVELLMLPRDVPVDLSLVVRAAEEAAELDGSRDDVWSLLALACCRADQLDKALGVVQASMNRPNRLGGDGSDWLILALIHARRGELDQARDWYDRGVAWYAEHDDGWRMHSETIRVETAALLGIEADPSERDAPGD